MRQQALPRLLGEVKTRLDRFDVHGIASEEFRRAVYTLYEMVRDIHGALMEVEREFEDAYEAFKRIAEKQQELRTADILGNLIAAEDEKLDKKDKSAHAGNYL